MTLGCQMALRSLTTLPPLPAIMGTIILAGHTLCEHSNINLFAHLKDTNRTTAQCSPFYQRRQSLQYGTGPSQWHQWDYETFSPWSFLFRTAGICFRRDLWIWWIYELVSNRWCSSSIFLLFYWLFDVGLNTWNCFGDNVKKQDEIILNKSVWS